MRLIIEIQDIDGSLDRGNLSHDLRINLNKICNKIEDNFKGEPMDAPCYLYDINDNRIGVWQITEDEKGENE